MSQANVIFNFDGVDLTIQCSKTEVMREICQKFATKSEKKMNSLLFIYNSAQLNLDLTFEDQANSQDKFSNTMNVLVCEKERSGFDCPYCGEKIALKSEIFDKIISAIDNIKDTLNGAKLILDNIIKNSNNNSVNSQLKSVNVILDSVNGDIAANTLQLKNLLNDNLIEKIENENNNECKENKKNIIRVEVDIEANKSDNIYLFNRETNNEIDVYLNDKKINMIGDIKDEKKSIKIWKVDYNFEKEGKYIFDI